MASCSPSELAKAAACPTLGGLLMLRVAFRLAPPPAVEPPSTPRASDAVGLGGAPPA
jgi:hypothetical protein